MRILKTAGFIAKPLLLACLFLLSCSKKNDAGANLRNAPSELDRLLSAAESMPSDSLFAEAQKLPGTWADTFFQRRFAQLLDAENATALQQAAQLFKQFHHAEPAATATADYLQGIVCQWRGRFDSAEIHYAHASAWFEKNAVKAQLIETLYARSGNATMQGRFDEAVAMKYQIIGLTDNPADRHHIQISLANTLVSKGEPAKALELLAEPLRFFEAAHDTAQWAHALSVQANAWFDVKNFEKALAANRQALALRRTLRGMPVAENLFNLSRTLGALGHWQAALDSIKTVQTMINAATNKQGQAYINYGMGEALFHLNRFAEASQYLANNLTFCLESKQLAQAAKTAELLAQSKKRVGKAVEALDAFEQTMSLRDSVFSKEKEKIIQDATVKYETREKEAQIASLKRENQLARERNFWIICLSSLLLFSGIWFVRFRQKKQREVFEKGLAAAKLENELLFAREQMRAKEVENQQKELESNRRQLEDFAAHLIEKNSQIEELQSRIEAISLPGESKSDKGSAIATGSDEDIDALFGASIVTEREWERFRSHFEKVFPALLGKLKLRFPELTTAETRLLMMTKMNLNTKEMSQMLGISVESVKKLKYRFRKKMGLSEEELLDKMEERRMED